MDAVGPLRAEGASPAHAAGKRFVTAREELELLLQGARALLAAERAADPENTHLAQLAGAVERALARATGQSFQMAVLALAKSGKSTLINALLGREVLPSSNVPETARIVRVRHGADADGRLHEAGRLLARGWDEAHDVLQQLNAEVRRAGAAEPPPDLLLEAPLRALEGRPLGDHPFEVLDTPGPNEAGAELLRASVDRLLREADVILYVLDYTKLRTQEERGIFGRLAALRPQLLGRLSERLFFAVNKIDLENSRGLSPDETRAYVAEMLAAQLPGLRIAADRVLLVSAEQALLARQIQSGRASAGALRDFARLCFGLRGQAGATLRRCRPHAAAVLEASGIVELEEKVVSYIHEDRGRLFLQSLLDDLERHLGGLENHLQTSWRALQIEQGKLEGHIARLEADRREVELAFEQIEALATRSADRIEGWVRQRFEAFQGEVEAALERACGVTSNAPAPARWQQLRALMVEEETADQTAAERRVAEAHQTIAANLRGEFAFFWGELEHAAWEQQRAMFGELERLIAALTVRIDDAVGRRLEISLRPVRLAFPPPSFEALQDELARRIESFVERRTREKKSRQQRRVLARRGGWCTQDQYRDETVEISSTITEFSFSRERVLAYWRDWLRARTEVSVRTARAIIHEQVGAAAEKARVQVDEYRGGYLRAVRRALADSWRGEQERARRLGEVERARARLAELQDRLRRCQEFLRPPEDT